MVFPKKLLKNTKDLLIIQINAVYAAYLILLLNTYLCGHTILILIVGFV